MKVSNALFNRLIMVRIWVIYWVFQALLLLLCSTIFPMEVVVSAVIALALCVLRLFWENKIYNILFLVLFFIYSIEYACLFAILYMFSNRSGRPTIADFILVLIGLVNFSIVLWKVIRAIRLK